MAAVHAAGPEPMITTFSIAIAFSSLSSAPPPTDRLRGGGSVPRAARPSSRDRPAIDYVVPAIVGSRRGRGEEDGPADRPARDAPLRPALPRQGVRHRPGRGGRRGRQLPQPPHRRGPAAEPAD